MANVPKSSNPWRYHVGDTSKFWQKFREAMVVNPANTSGLPLSDSYRRPPPGSRPENYAEPASKASDIAENPYYARDFRRMYPQTSVVSQNELSQLLLAQPEAVGLPAPLTPSTSSEAQLTTTNQPTLSSLYVSKQEGTTNSNQSQQNAASTNTNWLPPVPPGKRYVFKKSDGLGTVDPHGYFPMHTVS